MLSKQNRPNYKMLIKYKDKSKSFDQNEDSTEASPDLTVL